ncbi:transporter substrate-binding domain-containing protein [bacterium]|nr:transporter substrate-binding domain-containing protein [bacterium]
MYPAHKLKEYIPTISRYIIGFVLIIIINTPLHAIDTLRVGVHHAPSLSYLNNKGDVEGFCIDMMNVIAKQAGWHICYYFDTWPRLLKRHANKETDIIFPILKTVERDKVYDFSKESLFTSWGGIVTAQDANIESILDLAGKKIGGIEDDAFFINLLKLLRQFDLPYEAVSFEETDKLYLAISQGQVDAGALERLAIYYNASMFNLIQSPIVYSPGMAQIAVLKGEHSDFLSRYDEILENMKADNNSKFYSISYNWFGEVESFHLPQWISLILQIGGAAFFTLLVFTILLRKQVQLKTSELTKKNILLEHEIRDRILAEEKIKASLDEKTILLKEIHHRVKNNLQIISSLLNLQSASIKDNSVKAIFTEGQQRIRAIALIHETLYQSSNFTRINFGDFINTLVSNLYRTYWNGRRPVAIRVEAEVDDLHIDLAIPCGLIVTELVSNAFKYAFSNSKQESFSLAIALRQYNGDPQYNLELMVADNGVGLPEELVVKDATSLGLRLISILAEEQLKGRMQIERNPGTSFNIQFPWKN